MIRRHLIAFGCVLFLGTAWAIDPEPPFEDPALELTYQALINEVRCLVCQNQTIADSNAPLASDLRREIRQMMGEGASRGEVTEFLVARYGDFVLYRPPFQSTTWALWGAPVFLLVIGAVVFARILRVRMSQSLEESESLDEMTS
jgi:cytochrome c-type biogenesis protein CcmH